MITPTWHDVAKVAIWIMAVCGIALSLLALWCAGVSLLRTCGIRRMIRRSLEDARILAVIEEQRMNDVRAVRDDLGEMR